MKTRYGDLNRIVSIGEAASILGVTKDSMRKWESTGEVLPFRKTAGGTRYYRVGDLLPEGAGSNLPDVSVCYARVSSRDQSKDLDRQQEVLESFCAAKGWKTKTVRDIGSGMNYNKKGLREIIEMIMNKEMSRIVITHKDRMLRFGAEIIFAICEHQGIEVVVIHESEPVSFEEELSKDILQIITVFSSKLYGKRSHKNKKLIEAVKSGDTEEAAIILKDED